VKCTRNPKTPKGAGGTTGQENYLHSRVTTADIKWVPFGDQAEELSDVRPVDNDILIAKLRPGHVRHTHTHTSHVTIM
jgi:DNA-directed RNA polymerase I and III subunit RPAC1